MPWASSVALPSDQSVTRWLVLIKGRIVVEVAIGRPPSAMWPSRRSETVPPSSRSLRRVAFVTTVSLALGSGGPVEESLRLEPLTAASREEPAGAAPAARDATASKS